jgi:predicted nuclease of predicted toxin-antitoxin system
MGVSGAVAEWLRAQGHEAVHLRDQGLHRAADLDIFAKAIAEQRVVLTFDLDFGEIAALSRGQKASVILFRLQNTRTAHVIDRLAEVLADCVPALEHGAVVIVEESRHRVRLLPVGGTPLD